MEKICEFCTASRPVVYCNADGAHLCLSCDAKVHSANALSGRHLRHLLCDSCGQHPAYFRCLEHKMFLCQGCDRALHNSSSHQKQAVSSYLGCPSAKDFEELWGLNLNELSRKAPRDQFLSTLSDSRDWRVLHKDNQGQSNHQIGSFTTTSRVNFKRESKTGSSSQNKEVRRKYQQSNNSSFVLQQLLELKRLQLSEGSNLSAVMHSQEKADTMSSNNIDENLDRSLQIQDIDTNLKKNDGSTNDINLESLSFPQIDNFSSFSTLGFSLPGDSFWQCKGPDDSTQVWSQNMQDIGICEEPIFHDNFHIPDVDVTFENIEEMFDGVEEPSKELSEYADMSCSSVEKGLDLDIPNNSCTKSLEDVSMTSSVCNSANGMEYGISPSSQIHLSRSNNDSPCPIRQSLSVSLSRLSAKSGGADCLDTGISPHSTRGKPSCTSADVGVEQVDGEENAMTGHKEKKPRLHQKQLQYRSQKARADAKKQVKGRFIKRAGNNSDSINVTQSC